MRPYVRRQIGRLAERLVTLDATVRFFSRVGSQMSFERGGSSVRFSADSTKVRLGAEAAQSGAQSLGQSS